MQMAIIEAARNLLNIKTPQQVNLAMVVHQLGLINEWEKDKKKIKGTNKKLGGTMRLGSYEAILKKYDDFKNMKNQKLKRGTGIDTKLTLNLNQILKKGLIFSAMSPDGLLPEIIELNNHPWFIGVQFHPEFKSRPFSPHPLFSSFVKAAAENQEKS